MKEQYKWDFKEFFVSNQEYLSAFSKLKKDLKPYSLLQKAMYKCI